MASEPRATTASGSSSAFLGWAGLAVAGQAASLGVTQAGPRVGYQHVRVPDDPSTLWWCCATLLVLQAVMVAAAIIRRTTRGAANERTWLGANFAGWQLALLAIVLACSRAKIARPPEAYAAELLVSSLLAMVALATWVLAAQAAPAAFVERFQAWWQRTFGETTTDVQPGGLDRFAWIAAAGVTLATALLAFFVYERHPHVPDEVAYLFHARTFAAGELALSAPPVPQAFDVDLMLTVGERWFSPVPPGWPLALAAGAFFGAAWLVNPLLSGLTILLLYAFVREISSRASARVCVLLLACSPWFLFLGMSFMTHTWTNVCALTAALGVARARRAQPIAWTALAGFAIGVVSWIRPLEGLVLALLLGLWSIGMGGARLPLRAVACLVLATAISGAAVLPYNRELTGSASRHPIMDYVDRVYGPGKNDLGFGPDKGLDWGGLDPWPGHTPFQALVNSQFNAFALDVELFGWASGGLLLVVLGLLWSPRRRFVRACASVIVAVIAANGLYWFAGGPDFGARYWYLVLVPCVWLAGAGFEALCTRLGEAAARARLGLALAIASAMLTFMPWRCFDKYFHYRGMQPGIRALESEHDFGRSLVLVQGERHPDYASAAIYNPLDWNADAPLYAWDRDAQVRRELLAHYADRPVWIVAGPSRTGRGFELLAGPLAANEAQAWEAK